MRKFTCSYVTKVFDCLFTYDFDIFCRHGADNFCKLFVPRSGLFGSKLFDTLKVILNEFFKKYSFE